jgi:hypothetical protein
VTVLSVTFVRDEPCAEPVLPYSSYDDWPFSEVVVCDVTAVPTGTSSSRTIWYGPRQCDDICREASPSASGRDP